MKTPAETTPQPAAPQSGSLAAPASGVTVRMYNPGFGDCLLLTFRATDGSPRYLLIDCGAHHRYPDRTTRLQKIAADIAQATDHHLHIVAGTHEHTDHLDGFRLAADIFRTITIDHLWLAWTEDPDDPVANALRKHYDRQIRALSGVVNRMHAAGHANADRLSAVLEFEYGHMLGAAAGNENAPIPFLRGQAKNKLVRSQDYLRPGQAPITLPDVEGVKIYVFGPPVNQAMLRILERSSELYPEMAAASEANSLAAAVLAAEAGEAMSPDEKDLFQLSHPFDDLYRIDPKTAAQDPSFGHFFTEKYGFSGEKGEGPAWRRIDNDWLGAGENMALSINSYTNNTSLVLAVELTGSQPGKVLLFAADAQTGNWLSWQDLSWAGESPDGKALTADDLLARTVLYKVGHHGSRNATLSQKGLELMDSPGLVALIPVDQKWAHDAMHWEHPAAKLLARLEQKSLGRVLRTDRIPGANQEPQQPADLQPEEWQDFIQHLAWDSSPDQLWIQFTVPAQP